jgi:hypothetical protein
MEVSSVWERITLSSVSLASRCTQDLTWHQKRRISTMSDEQIIIPAKCTKRGGPTCGRGITLQSILQRAITRANAKEWEWGTENASYEIAAVDAARKAWYTHCAECSIPHTPQCLELQAQDQIYREKYPNFCRSCNGNGRITESYDPSPDGVSMGSGSLSLTDPCSDCTEVGICPRCGRDAFFGEGPCMHCGWDYDMGGRPYSGCECESLKEE